MRTIPAEVASKAAQQIAGEKQQAVMHFEALKRILNQKEPGWSDFD